MRERRDSRSFYESDCIAGSQNRRQLPQGGLSPEQRTAEVLTELEHRNVYLDPQVMIA